MGVGVVKHVRRDKRHRHHRRGRSSRGQRCDTLRRELPPVEHFRLDLLPFPSLPKLTVDLEVLSQRRVDRGLDVGRDDFDVCATQSLCR